MQGEDNNVKAQLALKLVSGVSALFKAVNSKKMSEENVELVPVEDSYLFNRDKEKTEAFNGFLPQSLIILIDLEPPSLMNQRITSAGTVTFPSAAFEIVRDQLYQPSVHMSMGPMEFISYSRTPPEYYPRGLGKCFWLEAGQYIFQFTGRTCGKTQETTHLLV